MLQNQDYVVCFILGCGAPPPGETPTASECYSCKYAQINEECVSECPDGQVPNGNKVCSSKYLSFLICVYILVCYSAIYTEQNKSRLT